MIGDEGDRAVMPRRSVAGQVLELVGCGPEMGVGHCGPVAVSQAQGQTPAFQPFYHFH